MKVIAPQDGRRWAGRRQNKNGFGSAKIVRSYVLDRNEVVLPDGRKLDAKSVLDGNLDQIRFAICI